MDSSPIIVCISSFAQHKERIFWLEARLDREECERRRYELQVLPFSSTASAEMHQMQGGAKKYHCKCTGNFIIISSISTPKPVPNVPCSGPGAHHTTAITLPPGDQISLVSLQRGSPRSGRWVVQGFWQGGNSGNREGVSLCVCHSRCSLILCHHS